MSASMLSMEALLTIWLPVGVTAVAAWRIHRRRPEVTDPARQALQRLLGTHEELPPPVRLVPGRPHLTLIRGEAQDSDAA